MVDKEMFNINKGSKMKKIAYRIAAVLSILLLMIVLVKLVAAKELEGYAKIEESQVELQTPNTNMTYAIVNLDEGVTTNGNYTNYGYVLIGLLGIDVNVTSLEDARTGNEEGNYCSYIIIPNTFSSQVASLNTQPEKAVISYAISPTAEGDERLEILKGVYNVYEVFGNNLSQIYTSSVLKEIHQIQDDSSALMARDVQDKEALDAINGYDLIEIIEIPDLTQVENTITALDLQNYLTIAQNKITDVDNSYKDFLTSGEAGLDELKGQADTTAAAVSQVEEKLTTVSSSIDTLPDSFTDDTEAETTAMDALADDVKTVINDYNTNVVSNNSNLILEQDKADDIVESYQNLYSNLNDNSFIGTNAAGDLAFQGYSLADMSTGNYVTEIDFITYKSNLSAAINSYMDGYETSLSSYIVAKLSVDPTMDIATIINNYSIDNPRPEFTTLAPEPAINTLTYTESAPTEIEVDTYSADDEPTWPAEQAQVDTTETDAKIQAIVDYSNTTNSSKLTTLKALEPTISTIKTSSQTLNETYTSQKESYSSLQTNLTTFNLQSYIDSGTISGHVGELSTNQSDMETAISGQNSQYETYVSDVYKATSEDVTKLQESISDGQERSQTKLEEALAEAKRQRALSSDKNIDILSDFANRLSYSRIGTLENKEVYDFMADPIILSDQSVAANTKAKAVQVINNTTDKTDSNQELYIGIGLIIAAAVLLFILGLIARARKKAKQDQEF